MQKISLFGKKIPFSTLIILGNIAGYWLMVVGFFVFYAIWLKSL